MNISSHPKINQIVTGEVFLNLVKSFSILNEVENDLIIKTALTISYPRIVWFLLTSKKQDGNPIWSFNNLTNLEERENIILKLMTESVFEDSIHRIAATFTASHIMLYIPINNNVKIYDRGKDLENQSIEDLNRLIAEVDEENISSSTNQNEDITNRIYVDSLNGSNVIDIQEDETIICYYYLNTNNSIIENFIYPLPSVLSKLIELIVLELNTLSNNNSSNILVGSENGNPSFLFFNKKNKSKVLNDLISLKFFKLKNDILPALSKDSLKYLEEIPTLKYGRKREKLSTLGISSVFIKQDLIEKKPTSNNQTSSSKNTVDAVLNTFHFKGEGKGTLKVKIMKNEYTTFVSNSIECVQELFQFLEQDPFLKGAITSSNSIRPYLNKKINNKDTLEVAISILEIPNGIDIALGDIDEPLTPFNYGRRTITVFSQVKEDTSEHIIYSSSPYKKSQSLQKTQDLINKLKFC